MEESDPGILNTMLEDYLAHAVGNEGLALTVWLQLGAERLARECGRGLAVRAVDGVGEFVRTATPSIPWRP